ncbi:MAG TPA: hypothetical protein VMF05_09210 [Stellaceae bacterium]|nr:hypothetical protein [Stellaceae bacterium]
MPASLAPYAFKPGLSGNPGGKGGAFYEAQKICRDASPQAARVLIELLGSPDDRVRLMAAREISERAWGRPKDYDPARDVPERRAFDPRQYSAQELVLIEQALLLMVRPKRAVPDEPEIIAPTGAGDDV